MKILKLLECWNCKKAYEEGEEDCNHVNGKYRGSAHQECNLNLSLNKQNPCCLS